jgi:REP element-mobilizing transposase RayT
VWHREYFDRYVRDDANYVNAVNYIHRNPVKAGLITNSEEWPWSSAHVDVARAGATRTTAVG